jgi:hypothetical protein
MVVFLVILVTFSSTEGNAANKYVLPDPDKTRQYVNNLIESYNALVKSNDSYRPDFASIKVYFKLYHDVGYSFKVIVAQALPNDPVANAGITNATDFLDLAFIPIAGNIPDIDMEYNRSASEISGFGGLTGAGNLREDLTINWQGGVRYQAIAYCIFKSDISSNDTLNSINSKNAAVQIYQADRSRIPASTTQATANTQSTSLPPSGIIEWIGSRPITDIFGIVGFVASVVYLYEKRASVRSLYRRLMQRLRYPGHEQPEQSKQGRERHNKQD